MWHISFLNISFSYLCIKNETTYIIYAFVKHKVKNEKVSNITRDNPVCKRNLPLFTNVQMHVFQNRVPLKRFTNGFTIIRLNQSHTFLKTWLFSIEWLLIVYRRWGQQWDPSKKEINNFVKRKFYVLNPVS